MYFNKEFDPEVECRPTFEQLSHERIVNEANKNINILKALENILSDRMAGYNSLHTTLTKTSSSHGLLENVDGTLKVALDSLFVFTEQVSPFNSLHHLSLQYLLTSARFCSLYTLTHNRR